MSRTTRGLLAVVLVPLSSSALADEAAREKIAQGKLIYDKHCAACHGKNLEGEPNWRQRKASGRLPAPPHDASGHTWHHSMEQLFRITKLGTEKIVGGDYKSDMPGFANILGDAEIQAVLAFIKSTWPIHIRQRHDAMKGRTK